MNNNSYPENTSQKEKLPHGDILLPVSSYHCLVPYSYTELAPHWHEEMEITLIREGCSNYRIFSDCFQAKEGDILLIPPRCLHSASEIPNQTMVSDSLVFHLDFLGASGQDLSASKYLRPLNKGLLTLPSFLCRNDHGYDEIREAFLDALTCFQAQGPYYELRLREYLLHLLILLFENRYVSTVEDSKNEKENRQQLKQILRFINLHYKEKLSISQLASFTGFSESHFMYYFKKNVGMTCVEYINHYRIHQAAQALENTALPVIDIALDHGFDNISYFNRQFRKQFGMTPREFRNK